MKFRLRENEQFCANTTLDLQDGGRALGGRFIGATLPVQPSGAAKKSNTISDGKINLKFLPLLPYKELKTLTFEEFLASSSAPNAQPPRQ